MAKESIPWNVPHTGRKQIEYSSSYDTPVTPFAGCVTTAALSVCFLTPSCCSTSLPQRVGASMARPYPDDGWQAELLAGVLAALSDALADDEAGVVRAAQAVLRRLLQAPAGAAALARLPAPARSYVGVFAPLPGAGQGARRRLCSARPRDPPAGRRRSCCAGVGAPPDIAAGRACIHVL